MFTEDIAAFFDTSALGEPATLTIGTSASSVAVIFDDAYIDPLGTFEGRAPTAWIAVDDATGVGHGDTVNVRGSTYTIVEIKPDGTGRVLELRMRT